MTHPGWRDPPALVDDRTALSLTAALMGLATLAAAVPFAAGILTGEWPGLTFGEAVAGTIRLLGGKHWADPARAYDDGASGLPGPVGFYTAVGSLGFLTLGAAIGVWRRLDVRRARSHLGRRPYDIRGSRPRGWALPRDLRGLVIRASKRDRFTVGHIDRRLLASDCEAHVSVCAPPRTGKTTRCVIPWLLEHEGPAVVTSTRRDVLNATRGWRERLGAVWVWDPFGADSAEWTPLDGCRDWEGALLQAQWLAAASADSDSHVARFWRGEAAKLLAPLLHAAALQESSMRSVLRWLDTHDGAKPTHVLETHGAGPARRQLKAIVELDPRNRGTTYMSAGALLAAYRYPQVLDSARSQLSAGLLLNGRANTLYIVASERHQQLLAPLVVALIASALHEAARQAHAGHPPSPTLRVLIDEAANIAPLGDLPRYISEAAGNGVRIATVWQSLAQMRSRYGADADTILAGSTAKLFMGPVTDETTRRYVAGLLGDEPVDTRPAPVDGRRERTTGAARRPRGAADALQQLGDDRAIMVSGSLPPAIVRLRPWWQSRTLSRRASVDATRQPNS